MLLMPHLLLLFMRLLLLLRTLCLLEQGALVGRLLSTLGQQEELGRLELPGETPPVIQLGIFFILF